MNKAMKTAVICLILILILPASITLFAARAASISFNDSVSEFFDLQPSVSGIRTYELNAAQVLTTSVVNSTNDPGDGICDAVECTLREAIEAANADPDISTINFAIPGAGVRTIMPASALPMISQPVTINGYTQPGAMANTSTIGNNAVILIELNMIASGSSYGLGVADGASTISGLIINRGDGHGIRLDGSGGSKIEGCFIGTDAGGTLDLGNASIGVLVVSPNNTVGGTSPAHRNVISGNENLGVWILSGTGNLMEGNYIGTDKNGTAALGNGFGGVEVVNSAEVTIGGISPGARNVISGNQNGVDFNTAGTNNAVLGNFIGTQSDGVSPLGNTEDGIIVNNGVSGSIFYIGGTAAGEGNVIAFNGTVGIVGGNGITVGSSATGIVIRGNAIYGNSKLGIDLTNGLPFGVVTPNDLNDGDTGANNRQNFPILTSATSFGGSTTIAGTLNSTANTTFRVEFFSNLVCDASGNGEGRTFLGAASVTTVGNNAAINVVLPVGVFGGQFITSTATDPANNTSEFSQCRIVMVPTSASVSVGGRVLTAKESGIYKAMVSITNGTGEIRTVLTNSFGYYRFDGVPVGETYIFSAQSKEYEFANGTQVLFIDNERSDVDFIAFP